ncbi:hypothetical protein INT47_006566, partial [Mucor saturninus]
ILAPTRRSRKPGPKKTKLTQNVTESSSEESSDAGSVTRCICGEAHNSGLMVQCDKCEVWQHCECIGLIQEKLPDHYYCDQCQPENHQLIKTPSGRSKRLYNTTTPWLIDATSAIIGTNSETIKPPSKKRKTSTSSPTTELILLDTVITNALSPRALQESPVSTTVEEMESLFVIEERTTRSRRTTATAASSSSSTAAAAAAAAIITTTITTTKTTCEEEPQQQQQQQQQKKKAKRATSFSPSPKQIHQSKSNSCPLLMMDEITTHSPYWNATDGKPTRESSPPAKIKYPNSKMTFYEMNKRAKQILDCVSKLQVEKPSTEVEIEEEECLMMRQRSLSCSSSSSLSSASTVPLLADDYTCPSSPSTPIPFIPVKQDESSVQILDRVTRELSKFQRKFGLLHHHHHHTISPRPPISAAAAVATTNKK